MKTATAAPTVGSRFIRNEENTGNLLGDPMLDVIGVDDHPSMGETNGFDDQPKPKHQSLVGFDPLLTPTSVSASSTVDHKLVSEIPSLIVMGTTTVPTTSRDADETAAVDPALSPTTRTRQPLQSAASLFRKKEKGHRKTQSLGGGILSPTTNKDNKGKNTDVFLAKPQDSLSPPRPVRRAVSTSGGPRPTDQTSSPQRKLPWHKRKSSLGRGHRHTQSVTNELAPPGTPQRPTRLVASATSSPVLDQKTMASMSPMIQELLEIDQTNFRENSLVSDDLLVPSLSAKPRPTSFLTGQLEETVRSSEQDPTPWQLEFPRHEDALVATKLCQFLETYAAEECLLHLERLVGIPRVELQRFVQGDVPKITGPNNTTVTECHRPIVEALLECGNDISEVKGFFTAQGSEENPENRREVLIVERQNKFLCVFRGSIAEQQGKFQRNAEMFELPGSSGTVLKDRFMAFSELQAPTFQLLDRLTEESPFCDINFTGHGFGAAIAIIASMSYANSRTALRVACTVTGSPKVGQSDFRWAVHSSPNLNLWRFEFGRHHIGRSSAVGHCARLIPFAKEGKPSAIQAYKFGLDPQEAAPMAAGANAVRSLLSPVTFKEKGIKDYVSMLESFGGKKWVAGFYKEDGAGVRGKDNEAREMA